jgi:spore coat protein A
MRVLLFVALAVACTIASAEDNSSNNSNVTWPLSKFRQRLTLPTLLEANSSGSSNSSGSDQNATTEVYQLRVKEAQVIVHPDLKKANLSTLMWTYNGEFPGPTIMAEQGKPIRVELFNELKDCKGHFLPVDKSLDTVEDGDQKCRVNIHNHGAMVNQSSDGFPLFWIGSDNKLWDGSQGPHRLMYDNKDAARFSYYRDLTMGLSHLNLYAGLAGAYLLDDSNSTNSNLPKADKEVILIIQDRAFYKNGSLYYPAQRPKQGMNSSNSDNSTSGQSDIMLPDEFYGDHVLVNGKVWPFMDVQRAAYRFRIVNAANARVFSWVLQSDNHTRANYTPRVWQIGGDQGLFKTPIELTYTNQDCGIEVAPGERLDIIIDFSDANEGENITMVNLAAAPYKGPCINNETGTKPGDKFKLTADDPYEFVHPNSIMQFHVISGGMSGNMSGNSSNGEGGFLAPNSLPSKFVNLNSTQPTRVRWHTLGMAVLDNGRQRLLINNQLFEDSRSAFGYEPNSVFKKLDNPPKNNTIKLNETLAKPMTTMPNLGDTEVWWIISPMEDVHPLHLHENPVQVLWRRNFDVNAFNTTGNLTFTGAQEDPEETEQAGLLDTFAATPGQVTAVLVTFRGYPGRYVFHCNVAEHEDSEMMNQFEIQNGNNYTVPLFGDLCLKDSDCSSGDKCDSRHICGSNSGSGSGSGSGGSQ